MSDHEHEFHAPASTSPEKATKKGRFPGDPKAMETIRKELVEMPTEAATFSKEMAGATELLAKTPLVVAEALLDAGKNMFGIGSFTNWLFS